MKRDDAWETNTVAKWLNLMPLSLQYNSSKQYYHMPGQIYLLPIICIWMLSQAYLKDRLALLHGILNLCVLHSTLSWTAKEHFFQMILMLVSC